MAGIKTALLLGDLIETPLTVLFSEDERREFEEQVVADMAPHVKILSRKSHNPKRWLLDREEIEGELMFELAKSMTELVPWNGHEVMRLYSMPYDQWRAYTYTSLKNRVRELGTATKFTVREPELTAHAIQSEDHLRQLANRNRYDPHLFLLWEFLAGMSEDARNIVKQVLDPNEKTEAALKRYQEHRDSLRYRGSNSGVGMRRIPARVMAEALDITLYRAKKAYREIKLRLTLREDPMNVGVISELDLPFGTELVTWQDTLAALEAKYTDVDWPEDAGNYFLWDTLKHINIQAEFRELDTSGQRGDVVRRIVEDDIKRGIPVMPNWAKYDEPVLDTAAAKALAAEMVNSDKSKKKEPVKDKVEDGVIQEVVEMTSPNGKVKAEGLAVKVGEPAILKAPDDSPVEEEEEEKPVVEEPSKLKKSSNGTVVGLSDKELKEIVRQLVTEVFDRLDQGDSVTVLTTRLSENNWSISFHEPDEKAAAEGESVEPVRKWSKNSARWKELNWTPEYAAFVAEMKELSSEEIIERAVKETEHVHNPEWKPGMALMRAKEALWVDTGLTRYKTSEEERKAMTL